MGFGNAASSFMTGFMAGYKFIDDAEKKQQEINALKAKAEAELLTEKLKLIDTEDERGKKLATDISKINEDVQNNVLTKANSPETALSIVNSGEASKKTLINNFNNTSLSKANLLTNTPMLGYVAQTVDFKDGSFISMTSDNGSTFITPRGNLLGTILQGDLLRKEADRQYSVDKDGYVFKKDEGGQLLRVASDGTTFIPDPNLPSQKQAQLATIDNLPYKFKEPTDNTPYPQNKIDDALKKRLTSVGMIPDANGNFPNLTWFDVKEANKVLMSSYTFDPKIFYDENGKGVLATNKEEMAKFLEKGYTVTSPKAGGADTQTYNTLKEYYIKQGLNNVDASKKAFTEIYDIKGTQKAMTEMKPIVGAATIGAKVAQGKDVSTEDATKASALMSPKLNPSQEKAISTFQDNVVSYDEFKRNYKILQDGIKSGTYKSDIVANIFSEWARAVPSGNMSIFGNSEELIKKYGIEANLANSLANVLRIQSGLTVNEAEAKRTVSYMMGGLNANEKVQAAAYKNFIDSTEFRLTRQATTIARYDPLTAKSWLDRNKNTPNFKTPAAAAAFKQYGYKPFKIGDTTYIVDKFSQDIKKVGNK